MKQALFLLTILAMVVLSFGCTQTEQPTEQTQLDSGMIVSSPTQIDTASGSDSEYSLADVTSHDYMDDCWTILNERVYDITDFIMNSPEYQNELDDSGMTADEFRGRLASMCGSDGTILFVDLFGENHARIDTYYVGELTLD
jgi:cytochrome b5-like protein